MVMPALARRWTREEVLALPDDGNRYELIDGTLLVSPSPRYLHQRAIISLLMLLEPYVRTHRIGSLVISPADLDFKSRQVLQPDLFVGALVDGREPAEWKDVGIPFLVVEILSPSTERYDRFTKRHFYQRSGVAAYWIVDLDAGAVEVWTPADMDPTVVRDTLTWHPDRSVPPLAIDLHEYFDTLIRT